MSNTEMQTPTERMVTHKRSANKMELSRVGTVAASLAATVGANLALGLPRTEQVEMPWFGTEERVERVLTPVSSTRVEYETYTQEQSAIVQTQSAEVGLEKWAEFFRNDPQAGELLDPAFTGEVVDQIAEIIENGSAIDEITVTGHSSAEDDNVNESGLRSGGLDTENSKNVELAEWRATVFTSALNQELENRGLEVPSAVTLGGVEDFLEEEELAELESLANQFGYEQTSTSSAVTNMIERYNRTPDQVPPVVQEVLDRMLKEERYVEVTIKYTGPTVAAVTRTIPSRVTETSLVEQEVTTEAPKKIRLTIPLFVILPIPIPRRREESTRSTAGQTETIPTVTLETDQLDRVGVGVVEKEKPEKPIIPPPYFKEKDDLFKQKVILNGHRQGYRPKAIPDRKQPREHNAHQRLVKDGGKMARDKGGNRSGKRDRLSVSKGFN